MHLTLDELLRELLIRLRSALGADSATVFFVDDTGKMLYPRAITGWTEMPAASATSLSNTTRVQQVRA